MFEDIWEQLNDLPLYGETVIRGHPVRRVAPFVFWIAGQPALTHSAAAEYLATARRGDGL